MLTKLLAIFLSGILVFSFAGCNSKDIESGPDSVEHTQGDAVDAEQKFIVMHYGCDAE